MKIVCICVQLILNIFKHDLIDININTIQGIKHEKYEGNLNSKVSYFLSQKQQEKLPAWGVKIESKLSKEEDEIVF